MDKKEVKKVYRKLFTPLEIEQKAINFLFILKCGKVKYQVMYNMKDSYGSLRKKRGWTIDKMNEDDWTLLKISPQEKKIVMEFCQEHLNIKEE